MALRKNDGVWNVNRLCPFLGVTCSFMRNLDECQTLKF